VAKAPVNWNTVPLLTPGMKNLGNQFNLRWPVRDGTSDGAVGDYKHQQGKSGHNPDDTKYNNAEYDDNDGKPEIRSIDVDNNLNDISCDMQDVIDHLCRLPNLKRVMRYMIYDEREYHVDNGFKPVPYKGASPHKEHAHFSGARSQVSDQDSTFDFQFEKVGRLMSFLPVYGESGEDVEYWQRKHNYVRKMYTPPCPEITVDGDYGAATAAAFVDFWKKNGGTGTYDGRKLESWVALKYDAAYSQFVAPKSPTADPAALTAAVNKWLEEKFKNGSLNIDGSLKGVVTL
jgi:peptidoglycan hydrolase-like protein with peptidoglycan-binding domain